MTIGTDTFPSDFEQEMRLAAIMGKIVDPDDICGKCERYFQRGHDQRRHGLWDAVIWGRLEKGTKADFVVFELDNIEMSPVRDVVKNIVYSSTRHSVRDVYVDGKCVGKGRKN